MAPAAVLAAPKSTKDLVQASLVADVAAVAPGSEFTIAIRQKIKSHWHTYWINPGESGQPTQVKWDAPEGFTFGQIQWPLPKKIVMDGAITYGYEDEVLLMVPVKVAKTFSGTGDATINADVNWLSCKDTCIEGEAKLSIKLPIAASAKPANGELFSAWKAQLAIPLTEASQSVVKVEQSSTNGKPQPALVVDWKQTPKKVEWFPVSTSAVAIENVEVATEGKQSKIQYKATVYEAKDVPQGQVDGVLVYEDAQGKRVGVKTPVKVSLDTK
jgi:DsbC/DsbD-like thiol-disulfide interchange protein